MTMFKRIIITALIAVLHSLCCAAQQRADSLAVVNRLLDLAESFDWKGKNVTEGLVKEGFHDDEDGLYRLPFTDDSGREVAVCYALLSGEAFVIACHLSYVMAEKVTTSRYGRQDGNEGSAIFWKKDGYRIYAMKDGFLDFVRRMDE